MTLIKTSLLNSIAVAIKMVTLFVLNKILAVLVGPAGYALIGQFQNAIQVIMVFANGAINTGVVRYTAEYASDEEKLYGMWRTATGITIVGSILFSILVFVFRDTLAIFFLKETSYSSVFTWFAFSLTAFCLNTLLLSVLNGKKEIYRYVVANICGSIFALAVTLILSKLWNLYGALVALATYQALSFVVTLIFTVNTEWFRYSRFFGKIDLSHLKKLSHYTLISLVSAVCVPTSLMFIREIISNSMGIESTGFFEAINRMSSAYLLFITSTLSVYYLPRISELKSGEEIFHEIVKCLKVIVPALLIFLPLIYVCRGQIILLLFNSQFTPISELIGLQLMGDFLKIVSWLLGYVLIAKGMTQLSVLSEVIAAVLFVLFVYLSIPLFGLKGAILSYIAIYLIYGFGLAIILWRKLLRQRVNE